MLVTIPLGRSRRARRAASVVEFAVVAPVILLFLFGALELGRAIMVQHMLQEAAQAGCRLYSVSDTTTGDATAIIDQALEDSGIETYAVTFDPANKADVDVTMEPVTVTVSVQYEDVGWIAPFYLQGAAISGSCIMPADIVDE